MIATRAPDAFIENFTEAMLNVRGMAASEPVVNLFPDFDSTLRAPSAGSSSSSAASFTRTQLLDLLTADYTFVNERLAKHTGSRTFTDRSSAAWSSRGARHAARPLGERQLC